MYGHRSPREPTQDQVLVRADQAEGEPARRAGQRQQRRGPERRRGGGVNRRLGGSVVRRAGAPPWTGRAAAHYPHEASRGSCRMEPKLEIPAVELSETLAGVGEAQAFAPFASRTGAVVLDLEQQGRARASGAHRDMARAPRCVRCRGGWRSPPMAAPRDEAPGHAGSPATRPRAPRATRRSAAAGSGRRSRAAPAPPAAAPPAAVPRSSAPVSSSRRFRSTRLAACASRYTSSLTALSVLNRKCGCELKAEHVEPRLQQPCFESSGGEHGGLVPTGLTGADPDRHDRRVGEQGLLDLGHHERRESDEDRRAGPAKDQPAPGRVQQPDREEGSPVREQRRARAARAATRCRWQGGARAAWRRPRAGPPAHRARPRQPRHRVAAESSATGPRCGGWPARAMRRRRT